MISVRCFLKQLYPALLFIIIPVSPLLNAMTQPVNPEEYAGIIRVACVGDSNTYGMKIDNPKENAYPAQLQTLLGNRYEVKNFGHSGARVCDKTRKPYMKLPEFEAALSFKPHVVIISLGINDALVSEWSRNMFHFVEDYTTLVQRFQQVPVTPSPKIWLGTLLPVMPPYEPYIAIQETKAEVDAMINEIAKEFDLPVIDLFTRLNMEPQCFPDGLHTDKKGARILAQTICKAITGDHGGLQMPWVFGDHMVLQRQKPIPIFGTANVGSVIAVKLGCNEQQTTTDHNGQWRVDMPIMNSGKLHTLTCSDGKKTLTYSDVLIGEVWYASGQSNMDWRMSQDVDWATEGPLANEYSEIRILNRQGNPDSGSGKWSQTQIDNVTVDTYYSGQWQVGSQKSAAAMSAVAYYFARDIHRATSVPVGIIDNSRGGAPMEAFIPRQALAIKELYSLTKDWINAKTANDWHRGRAKQNLGRWFEGPKNGPMPHHPFEPCFLFNADTADLIPFAIRGVIWYQGESNATDKTGQIAWNPEQNHRLFEALITSWRQVWNRGDFPFYYVQLPNLNRNWMLFRQMQLQTLDAIPNTGMAVTIDVGQTTSVHPAAKQEVGRRLGLWARAKIYGESRLVYSGPLYNGTFIDEGTKLRVGFDHVGGGLRAYGGGALTAFEVSDAYGNWHPASATIDCSEVVVSSNTVGNPKAVRYAWAPNPDTSGRLINAEGLPASPFRAGDFNVNPNLCTVYAEDY